MINRSAPGLIIPDVLTVIVMDLISISIKDIVDYLLSLPFNLYYIFDNIIISFLQFQ